MAVAAQLLQAAPGFDWNPLLQAVSAAGVLVVGALAAYIVRRLGQQDAKVDEQNRKIDQNTKLTAKVEQQTNGRFKAMEAALAKERDTNVGLIGLVRMHEDLLRYIVANHPTASQTIARFQERRSNPAPTNSDMHELERRLMRADEEAPR
jgi:hypothetical protein